MTLARINQCPACGEVYGFAHNCSEQDRPPDLRIVRDHLDYHHKRPISGLSIHFDGDQILQIHATLHEASLAAGRKLTDSHALKHADAGLPPPREPRGRPQPPRGTPRRLLDEAQIGRTWR